MKQVIIVANSITDSESMSGGDKNFIELAKIWKKQGLKIFIITTKIGKEMCLRAGLGTDFVLLPDLNPGKYGVILTYLFRSLTSFYILTSKIISKACCSAINHKSEINILSSSHYLPDILPALWLKIKFLKANWGVFLHLLFPPPFKGYLHAYQPGWQIPNLNETLNWLFQFPSLFLVKHFGQKVFCVNEEIISNLTRQGFTKDKLRLYQNGIDHEYINRIKPFSKIKFDGLFIGRFHPQKGLPDLIPIWSEVTKSFPKAKLGIIGSGPKGITNKFLAEIKHNKLEKNLDLLGFIDGENKFALIKSSKVLLFPSYYESFGIVPLEAQACGKPILAYDLPPVKSIFKKGVLFSPLGDTNKFSELIIKLLEDKSFYQEMSRKAYEHSQNFTWERSSQQILDTL